MEKYIINGGKPLYGEIEVPCAKNAYLAILAGCVLSSGTVKLKNCPNFDDVNNMIEMLSDLGAVILRQNSDVI